MEVPRKKKVSKKVKKDCDNVSYLLNQYFQYENAKLSSPFASSETLLSHSLATEIAAEYARFNNADVIQNEYPNLKAEYCAGITAVLAAYLHKSA